MASTVSDERLDQLANDPMMCNITEEVQCCLRELIRARKQLRDMQRGYNEEIRDAARDAREAVAEAYWAGKQGDDYPSW